MNDSQEDSEEQPIIVLQPPQITRAFNQTSILLTRSHDDSAEETECSYCKGIRHVVSQTDGVALEDEKECTYHKLGFSTTKMRAQDLETCLNSNFTRCGTYIYQRNSATSCCEVYQYRVDINEFKISQS